MPLALLPYPQIDPVLVQFGPFAIRWYALAYIAGLLIGWWFIVRMLRETRLWADTPFNGKPPATADDIGDLVVWATLGVIIGGRLGWVLFYGVGLCSVSPHAPYCYGLPGAFLTDPIKIVAAWQGGMSFHGGMVGVFAAIWLFCRRHKLDAVQIGDLVAAVAPIGLFFGRIANFINDELWGRPTNVPWAMIFPRGGDVPRHPSQLYEAALEGILLFVILQVALRVFGAQKKPGLIVALFFTFYAAFRTFVEFFREPDARFIGWLTMGMTLSILMLIAAAFFYWYALFRPKRP
jgi:phosphatidylglycerol:prolipoprotein diacylglycerol transferase